MPEEQKQTTQTEQKSEPTKVTQVPDKNVQPPAFEVGKYTDTGKTKKI